MYQLLLCGGLSTCFQGVDKWFPLGRVNNNTATAKILYYEKKLTQFVKEGIQINNELQNEWIK
jgi:hypothetical protein